MLSIVIDAARLGGNRPFAQEVEAIKDYIRQSRIAPGFDEILMPGEPEARSRAMARPTTPAPMTTHST